MRSAGGPGPPAEYQTLLESSRADGLDRRRLIDELTALCSRVYRGHAPSATLLEFDHGPAAYIFDEGAPTRAARTVLAIARGVPPSRPRDAAYQRGFPSRSRWHGRALDRGHFISYGAGGLFGPNLFDQNRALNRGWSTDGRRYRAAEAVAVHTPETALLVRPVYLDDTDFPAFLDLALVDATSVRIERFRNRFDAPLMAGESRLGIELAGATDAQIGGLGEETAAVLVEAELGGTIVALGDAGMPRDEGRQDIDILAVVGETLIAYEVKTRYRSRWAGRLTRTGNLPRPTLRPGSGVRYRQGSQAYVTERLRGVLDVDESFEGIEVRVLAVDLVGMVAQEFAVDDHGRRLHPCRPPLLCTDAAAEALDRIIGHRGYL